MPLRSTTTESLLDLYTRYSLWLGIQDAAEGEVFPTLHIQESSSKHFDLEPNALSIQPFYSPRAIEFRMLNHWFKHILFRRKRLGVAYNLTMPSPEMLNH